jgi:DNA-binding MarR family transcriptional regulator
VLVQLTDHGRETTRQLSDDYDAGSAALFADLPPEDVQRFLGMLDTVTARLSSGSGR